MNAGIAHGHDVATPGLMPRVSQPVDHPEGTTFVGGQHADAVYETEHEDVPEQDEHRDDEDHDTDERIARVAPNRNGAEPMRARLGAVLSSRCGHAKIVA